MTGTRTPPANDGNSVWRFGPKTLTPAQLVSIYTCRVTNWNQVGGGNQVIKPFLPQSGNEGVNSVLNNPAPSSSTPSAPACHPTG